MGKVSSNCVWFYDKFRKYADYVFSLKQMPEMLQRSDDLFFFGV